MKFETAVLPAKILYFAHHDGYFSIKGATRLSHAGGASRNAASLN